jgi:multisubunit Na+/H+ antiporter MnhF subunit
VTPFLIAATALVASLILPLLLIVRGGLVDAVIALELAGVTVTLLMLLFAAGDADSSLADPAVVLAFLTFGGSLVYVHYVEERV